MTNAEARFNNSLRPRKPEGSLGRTAQDVHLDSHTAPELCSGSPSSLVFILEAVRLLRLLCLRNKNEHCVSVYNYMNANTEEAVSLFCGPSNASSRKDQQQ